MTRARARARATREVSIVIHRRPHCSATYAVVPEPQVGSRTRSPGSVAIKIQRSTTAEAVWTTYVLSLAPLKSFQMFVRVETEKSPNERAYRIDVESGISRVALRRRAIPI